MTMPANDRQKQRPEEHLTDAQLNELVDATLSTSESERAQTHLTTCAECDERYRTLLATVSALKTAPSLMPRRSFQLTPQQAKLPEPKVTWIDRFSNWIVPGVPALRAATLAVALLLLSVTAIDVLTNQSNNSENAGPVVMRQVESTLPTDAHEPPVQANGALPTSAPLLQESGETGSNASTGGAPEPSDGAEGALGGAIAPAETSEEAPSSAPESSNAPSSAQDTTADEEIASSDESDAAVAPAAPAAAMPPQSVGESTSEEPPLMAEAPLPASPAASPLPTPSPSPSATASPVPAIATPEATPASTEQTSGGSENRISRWRIAEFALLLIFIWLAVTWFGRTRLPEQVSADDQSDSDQN